MAHSGWRVTSQVPDQFINTDAGKTETGTFIYFITGDGNSGVVFVANRHIGNIKTVKNILHAQAQLVDDIGALQSGAVTGNQQMTG
jgi:hypothetical protein